MKPRMVTVAALLIFLCSNRNASAQIEIAADLQAGQWITYTHRVNPGDRGYDIAYRCTVPPLSLGVVTLVRISGDSSSQHDVEVADRLELDAAGRMVASEVLGEDSGASALPKVIPFGLPSPDTLTHLVVIHARDEVPAEYKVYCDSVSIPEQIGWALLKTAVNAFFREYAAPDMAQDDNIGRMLNLGMSLAMRDNLLAIGLDAFREEVIIELEKQFPDNPYMVIFFTALTVDVMQKAYEHAFYEMSGFR